MPPGPLLSLSPDGPGGCLGLPWPARSSPGLADPDPTENPLSPTLRILHHPQEERTQEWELEATLGFRCSRSRMPTDPRLGP